MIDIPMAEAAIESRVNAQYYDFEIEWDTPLHLIAEVQLQNLNREQMDDDWQLKDYFGGVYVINLPTADVRKESVTQELNEIGLHEIDFYVGIDGRKEIDEEIWRKFKGNRDSINASTPVGRIALDKYHQGEAGCYMSHYTLIKKVKECFDQAMSEYQNALSSQNETHIQAAKTQLRKYSRVLILEDDAGFGYINSKGTKSSKRGCGKYFREALMNLPEDWNMLYFVTNPTEPTQQVANNLYKIKRAWSQTAYAINYTMYDALVKQLEKIEYPEIKTVLPVDNMIAEIHSVHKVYAVYPSLAFNQDFPSQISPFSRNKLWQGQPIYGKRR